MKYITPFIRNSSTALDFWKDMDLLFNHNSNSLGTDDISFSPATEIVESEDKFSMSMDLPGMSKENVKIEINDGALLVSGERKRESKSETEKVQRIEKSYGFFKRSFVLPKTVDPEKVEAKFENGVLELNLPKTKLAAVKKIEIQ